MYVFALIPRFFITLGVILILVVCSIIFYKLKLKILEKCLFAIVSLLFLGQLGYSIYNLFILCKISLHEFYKDILYFAPYLILFVSYLLLSFSSFFLIFKKDNE
jgi:hypothetical protein